MKYKSKHEFEKEYLLRKLGPSEQETFRASILDGWLAGFAPPCPF